ncbi:MAG: phage minor head protein [Mixta calida]|nr:phage head morphogenesis protein [Pantoea sp.]MDU5189679.1 phage minor head protein [Mixta calida]
MFRDIESRYYQIKVDLRHLFDEQLIGREVEANSQSGYAVHGQVFYQVNIGRYIYDLSARALSRLLESVQGILDRHLLDGGEQNLWAMTYITDEYERGTRQAFTNLSVQSVIYEQQTSLAQLLTSPGYLNQIAATQVATYSEWRSVSDKARGDLANVITDAVARGINPCETARIVSERLNVSMSSAKRVAMTEQLGALRQAQSNEADWSRERLGLNTAILWISALLPTSRQTHVARHGHTYSTEEVADFYSRNGNRYNCHCATVPCILDEKGKIVNAGLVEKLAKERKQYQQSEG